VPAQLSPGKDSSGIWAGDVSRGEEATDPPADAARGVEEPVHEDAGAVVVWVVGQQPVPLVLLGNKAIVRVAGERQGTCSQEQSRWQRRVDAFLQYTLCRAGQAYNVTLGLPLFIAPHVHLSFC
jgi:hypothetical protein